MGTFSPRNGDARRDDPAGLTHSFSQACSSKGYCEENPSNKSRIGGGSSNRCCNSVDDNHHINSRTPGEGQDPDNPGDRRDPKFHIFAPERRKWIDTVPHCRGVCPKSGWSISQYCEFCHSYAARALAHVSIWKPAMEVTVVCAPQNTYAQMGIRIFADSFTPSFRNVLVPMPFMSLLGFRLSPGWTCEKCRLST